MLNERDAFKSVIEKEIVGRTRTFWHGMAFVLLVKLSQSWSLRVDEPIFRKWCMSETRRNQKTFFYEKLGNG